MNSKNIVIITLTILTIYLIYRQNTKPNLLGNSEEKLTELKQKVDKYLAENKE